MKTTILRNLRVKDIKTIALMKKNNPLLLEAFYREKLKHGVTFKQFVKNL